MGVIDKFLAVLNQPITLFLLVGQACFFLRFFAQWRASEKQAESIIPLVFWFLSLGGAGLTLVYFIHRRDPILAAAQVAGLCIYLRNLNLIFRQSLRALLLSILGTGLVMAGLIHLAGHFDPGEKSGGMAAEFLAALDNPIAIFGIAGQAIFSTRFILQWVASERRSESTFPVAFWLVSILGSLFTLVWLASRFELVLILAQLFGLFIYSRNLHLVYLKRRQVPA
jgi:lipid-A-disaccharide synthase-like uncharacterized protein